MIVEFISNLLTGILVGMVITTCWIVFYKTIIFLSIEIELVKELKEHEGEIHHQNLAHKIE